MRPPDSLRALDVAVSAAGLLLLWPVFVVIGIAIARSSPGPVLYKAVRVGREGRPFVLYKFRTMVRSTAGHGPAITTAADPRVTPIGRFLRRTKLDELPQLANVLKGEMSLVGPRPEDPHYVVLYTPEQRRVLEVRPGITGAASLEFRDEESLLTEDWERRYIEEIMPTKLQIELDYLAHRSAASDLWILARTALVLTGRGGSGA
ncbi:MAG: sugar transferase [Thermoleophilia bacterium]|nr:sugar transferase [Thermoleophilia bacterium]